jgi:hypothetical protein
MPGAVSFIFNFIHTPDPARFKNCIKILELFQMKTWQFSLVTTQMVYRLCPSADRNKVWITDKATNTHQVPWYGAELIVEVVVVTHFYLAVQHHKIFIYKKYNTNIYPDNERFLIVFEKKITQFALNYKNRNIYNTILEKKIYQTTPVIPLQTPARAATY